MVATAAMLEFILGGMTDLATNSQQKIFELFHLLFETDELYFWSAIYSNKGSTVLYSNVVEFKDGKHKINHTDRLVIREDLKSRYPSLNAIDISIRDISTINGASAATFLIFYNGEDRLSQSEHSLLERSIAKHYSDFAANARASLREQIVACTVRSRDLTSFFHRCVTEVLRDNFGSAGASIFYFDNATDALILGATTGITFQNSHQTKRADIKYFRDSDSWVSRCFDDNAPILEDMGVGDEVPVNTYGENVANIVSRIYLPLRVRPSVAGANYSDDIFDPVGVIRIVNLNGLIANQPILILQVTYSSI